MMKRTIILLFVITAFIGGALAQNKSTQQHMSATEFREKQQAFITEKADLTKEEATKFFPLYFQLQDKKKELNDKAWALIREGKEENLSETQYNQILENIYDTRIATAELEKNYYLKFKQILPAQKIYMIQKAEMRFHREMLKGMNNKTGGGKPADSGSRRNNK